jgi:hypothetical protein
MMAIQRRKLTIETIGKVPAMRFWKKGNASKREWGTAVFFFRIERKDDKLPYKLLRLMMFLTQHENRISKRSLGPAG